MKHHHSHATYHVKRHRKGHKVTMHAVDGTKDSVKYETREDANRGLHAHVADHLRQGNKAQKLREAEKKAASMAKPKDKSKLRKTLVKSVALAMVKHHTSMAELHESRGESELAAHHRSVGNLATKLHKLERLSGLSEESKAQFKRTVRTASVQANRASSEHADSKALEVRKSMSKPAKSYHMPTATYHVHALGDGYVFMHHPVGGKPEMSAARYRNLEDAWHGVRAHAAAGAAKRSAHDEAAYRGEGMKTKSTTQDLKKSVKWKPKGTSHTGRVDGVGDFIIHPAEDGNGVTMTHLPLGANHRKGRALNGHYKSRGHAMVAVDTLAGHNSPTRPGEKGGGPAEPSPKPKRITVPKAKKALEPDMAKADTCKRCGGELANTGKDTHVGGMCPACAKKAKAKKSLSNDQLLANRISKAGFIGQETDRVVEPKLTAGTVRGEIMKSVNLAVELAEAEHRVFLKSECPAHAYGFGGSAGGIESAGTMGLTVCNCDKPMRKSDLAEVAAKKLKEMRENVAALKMAQEMGIPVTDSSWLQNLLTDEE